MRKPYFEGWYLKQQGEKGCLAVIPSFHIDENGEKTAWLQVITEAGAYSFSFPAKEYTRSRKHFLIKVGNNVFSKNGILLNLEEEGISIHGKLHFGRFMPPEKDLMGPFRFLSMECSHGVESFYHRVDGNIVINHRVYQFTNGRGYIERDSGHSFPEKYGWSHTFLEKGVWQNGGSPDFVMACAGKIPLGKGFWGCVAVLCVDGREYKLATYRGARVIACGEGRLLIRQGKSWLEIYEEKGSQGNGQGQKLHAPRNGSMKRKVEEKLSGTVHYRFFRKGRCLLNQTVNKSSIEFG